MTGDPNYGSLRTLSIPKAEPGFTLIEAMVAILILSVGFLGVGTMLNTAFQNDRYNNRMRLAQACAQTKIEEIKSSGTSNIPASGTEETGGLTREWNIEEDSLSGTNKITITVRWGKHEINQVSYTK